MSLLLKSDRSQMVDKSFGDANSISEITVVIDNFNRATTRLENAYRQLEHKVSVLNLELAEKNRALEQQLHEIHTLKTQRDNILQSMRTGVVAIDLDGCITLFNTSAEQLIGKSAKEVLRKNYIEIFGDEKGAHQNALSSLHTGCVYSGVEDLLHSADGETKPIRRTTSLVRDENGNTVGAMEILEDITELKRLQYEIQNASTLAALGEMARQVAHDIRNPLGGIAGFAALLERDFDSVDPRKRLIQKVIEGVGVLDQLVSDLLLFTRPLEPNLRSLDIVRMTVDMLAFARMKYEDEARRITVHQRFPQQAISARIDVQLFQELILHIFRNAARSMPDGGELTVSICPIESKHKVTIEFADTGKGLSPEVRKKLFYPFFSTYSRGSGLGLSIVKRIVEIHDGEINLETTEGKGTKVQISFPYKSTHVD